MSTLRNIEGSRSNDTSCKLLTGSFALIGVLHELVIFVK